MIFGRPETFALEVRPLSGGPGADDPAANATWAGLRMVVAGRNLFRNVVGAERTVSEDVLWPSIFLARWFVRSWSDLFHTPPWPKPITSRNARDMADHLDNELADNLDLDDSVFDARDHFVQSHALRAAAAGAAMPDVWIARDLDVVSISWHDSMDGDRYFTLSKGESDVSAVDFAEAVHGFVDWVTQRLLFAQDARLTEDIDRFQEWLSAFYSPAGSTAAMLTETGIDHTRMDALVQQAAVHDMDALLQLPTDWSSHGTLVNARQSAIALAFRCASPALNNTDLLALRTAIVQTEPNAVGFSALDALASQATSADKTLHDFTQGYRLARAVRRVLGNEVSPIDIDALLRQLNVPVSELVLGDDHIDAACVCDLSHGPAIFVNPDSARASAPWGRRVALAHELCHLLFDRKRAAPLAIVSGPWAPPRIERVANAFAIELLLPLAGILATVGPVWDTAQDDHITTLMDHYGLGITAVTEHLRNMRDHRNR